MSNALDGLGAAAQRQVMINPSEHLEISVSADDTERLDRFLARHVPTDAHLSRARLQALIGEGAVRRVGPLPVTVITATKTQVRSGDVYQITLPPAIDAEPVGEMMDLDVVHEDRDIIVIDKPAGLVVHPAAGHETGTLVNALIAHCGDTLSGIGGVKRPGIVHRLDKDTSGLLVVAKNDAAHQHLSEQFRLHGADGRLVRRYTGFAWGVPERPKGMIEADLARSTSNRTKIAVTRGAGGRQAITHYEITGRLLPDKNGVPLVGRYTLILETGRTHQIRVHLAHIGHPLLGDKTYGTSHLTRAAKLPDAARSALDVLGRQALHAAVLGFVHPRTEKVLQFRSPLPDDLAALERALSGEAEPKAVSARRPAGSM
jgi:23S rRNA pseudouridine1911/1915/1917 synthase